MKRLLSILALKRGHGSIGEDVAIDKFLMPYDPVTYYDTAGKVMEPMAFVITTDPDSKTLFSCHVDTVHATDAFDVKNHVIYDANLQIAYKDKNDPTPLGADDGAGWWLLLEMIDAGVPGTYIFHRGEERGGIGSKWMADNEPEFLKKFSRAVAFDRRGRSSVITHQGMDECCSDTFAGALATALAESGLPFAPDDTGIYTDTAEYIGLIPECTNISCGYEHEHSSQETLDVEFLVALRGAVIGVDWEALPTVRTPRSRYSWQEDWFTSKRTVDKTTPYFPYDEWDVQTMRYREVVKFCKAHPEDAADLLMDLAERLVEASVTEQDSQEAMRYDNYHFTY